MMLCPFTMRVTAYPDVNEQKTPLSGGETGFYFNLNHLESSCKVVKEKIYRFLFMIFILIGFSYQQRKS